MCTVTFLPASDGSYLLVTNRDERPSRAPADPPLAWDFGGTAGVAPRDPEGGGTWVATLASGHTVCLLNGDEAPAGPPVVDPVSRGIVCVDTSSRVAGADLERPDATVDLVADVLAGHGWAVRPFKLLVATPDARPRLDRVEWTGAELVAHSTHERHLAVSSTFRRADVTAAREAEFARWGAGLGDDERGAAAWIPAAEAFHGGHAPGVDGGDAYSVCMHRGDARSVSTTLVAVDAARVRMTYRRGSPCRTLGELPAEHALPRAVSDRCG